MEEVLATLTSFPEAADAAESPKKRDSQIRAYIKSISTLSDAARAAILANPAQAFEVRSDPKALCLPGRPAKRMLRADSCPLSRL